MLRQDDWQKAHLVDEGWRWGQEYGGHLAACLVMSCLSNRVKKGWGTLPQILSGISKFSAVSELPELVVPSIWDAAFVRLLHEVEAIYDGSVDYAKGAVYWADTRRIDTPFFLDKILPNKDDHPCVVEMNTLRLYK